MNKNFLKKNIKKLLMINVVLLMITACGYKPSSVFIKKIFYDTVYVEVEVDSVEPENASFVKDEMNRVVYTRFKGRVVSKEEAKSKILINYKGTTFNPVAIKNGYVTRYSANIRVNFKMTTKDGIYKKSISARHEADIQASSIRSSTLRTEAIRIGLAKALDQFIAYVSVKGILKKKKLTKGNKTIKENNALVSE